MVLIITLGTQILSALSPQAQMLFIGCIFLLTLFLLIIVTFFPKATNRLIRLIKQIKLSVGDRRKFSRDNDDLQETKNEK